MIVTVQFVLGFDLLFFLKVEEILLMETGVRSQEKKFKANYKLSPKHGRRKQNHNTKQKITKDQKVRTNRKSKKHKRERRNQAPSKD